MGKCTIHYPEPKLDVCKKTLPQFAYTKFPLVSSQGRLYFCSLLSSTFVLFSFVHFVNPYVCFLYFHPVTIFLHVNPHNAVSIWLLRNVIGMFVTKKCS